MEPDEFINWHRGRVLRTRGKAPSEETLNSKRSRLRTAFAHSGSDEWSCFGTLTQDPVCMEQLLDKLMLEMTPGSVRLVFDALRDFNEYARVRGWADGNGLAVLTPPPRNPQKPIFVYTDEEVTNLVQAARGVSLRWWAFLATLAETGRRVGEALKLEWAWLHLDAEPPFFGLPTTKNGRQQYVPLTRMLREDVFTPEHISVLVSGKGNRPFRRSIETYPFPWSYSTVEKMFERHCARVRVEDRGFHNFRHTRATELLAKGVPIQAVSALLGHANTATTDRLYNHATALDYARYVD